MLWDSTRVSVQILQAHHQFIHTRMQLAEGQTSLFTAVYASPMRHERRQLWKELNNIAKSNQEPWVLVGDWNMILDASEKMEEPHQIYKNAVNSGKFSLIVNFWI